VNVLPSMPQLGAKIRRTGVGADEEESSPVQLHDGETANFELVRIMIKFGGKNLEFKKSKSDNNERDVSFSRWEFTKRLM